MSTLKWVRIEPGHYQTPGYVNGYQYRIRRNAPGWPYALDYRWENDSTGTWKRPLNYSHNTIKGCQWAADRHQENPRQRWVFVRRADNPRGEASLVFKPADEDPRGITSSRYFLPVSAVTGAR